MYFSHLIVSDSLTPWTVVRQPPLPMGYPGRNTGEGSLPFSRDLPNPGIEPRSPALQADSLLSEPQVKPRKLVIK